MTSHYKLTIEYDGTPFCGFQFQPGMLTVQDELEKALVQINKGIRPKVYVAGRTDTGVHAFAQVVHVTLDTDYNAFKVMNAANHYLRDTLKPQSVSVIDAQLVKKDFHARFSAIERSYVYKIINRQAPIAIDANRAWHVYIKLDVKAMNKAAQFLVGHHDFTSFRSTECQGSTPMKTLDELSVYKAGNFIEIKARSRSFLHHQVRNMVGTLKLVGEGKWVGENIKKALDAKDRRAGGPTAPAHGLYLLDVKY